MKTRNIGLLHFRASVLYFWWKAKSKARMFFFYDSLDKKLQLGKNHTVFAVEQISISHKRRAVLKIQRFRDAPKPSQADAWKNTPSTSHLDHFQNGIDVVNL